MSDMVWKAYQGCLGLALQQTDEELALPAAIDRLGRHAWHNAVSLSQDEARELATEAVRVETLRREAIRLRSDVDGLIAACKIALDALGCDRVREDRLNAQRIIVKAMEAVNERH